MKTLPETGSCPIMDETVRSELAPRFPISSDTEFNRLRSIIVGRAVGANHPDAAEPSFRHFFVPPAGEAGIRASGPVPQGIIDEIEEDLTGLVTTLEQLGVQVFRPEPHDSTTVIKSPDWSTTQLYSLMPRDCLLVIGKTLIEVPSPTRARYFEVLPFRKLLYQHRKPHSFRWICAPRPHLADETFPEGGDSTLTGNKLPETEILFDAANCVRMGRDIFIDINLSANYLAAEWLQHDVLGNEYRVHTMELGADHADVTLIPVRPGLLLVDRKTVSEQNIPAPFKSWDLIKLESMPELQYGLSYPLASNKIGMNLLMVDHDTAIVEQSQTGLIGELEKRGVTAIPVRYRHGRTLGGSFHCVTLDLCRDSIGGSYL